MRMALTTRTAREIHAMVQAFDGILQRYNEQEVEYADIMDPLPSPQRPISVFSWNVRWDGSFNGQCAGLGITISLDGHAPCVKLSVPVYASDATRCEALGPALASLIMSRF